MEGRSRDKVQKCGVVLGTAMLGPSSTDAGALKPLLGPAGSVERWNQRKARLCDGSHECACQQNNVRRRVCSVAPVATLVDKGRVVCEGTLIRIHSNQRPTLARQGWLAGRAAAPFDGAVRWDSSRPGWALLPCERQHPPDTNFAP